MEDRLVRILIADDESKIRDLYRAVLKKKGPESNQDELNRLEEKLFRKKSESVRDLVEFELLEASQAEEAVEVVRKSIEDNQPIQVAFLDVRMPPGKDGIWAAETIRTLDPDIQIVIVTAFADTDIREITRRVPPVEKLLFILKPFHPVELGHFASALSSKWFSEHSLRILQEALRTKVDLQEHDLENMNKQIREDLQTRMAYERELARHALVFENMDEAVVIIDRDYKIADTNPAFTGVFGMQRQEIIGESVFELYTPTTGIDKSTFASVKDSGTFSGEVMFNCPGSKSIWTWTIIKPFSKDGEFFGYISISLDITDRKRTELALSRQRTMMEDVFSRIHEGIIILNEEEDIVFSNPGFARIFEVDSRSVMGANFLDFIDNRSHEIVLAQNERRKSNEITDYEVPIITGKQNKRMVKITAYPRMASDGKYIGSFGVVQDVTEERRMQEQFLQAQKMEAMGRLAGGVAHDFNNVLTIINGSAELVKMSVRDPRLLGYIDEIILSTMQAKKLTSQLLLFSRKQEFDPIPLDLNTTIRDTEKLLRRVIGVDVDIKLELDSDIGVIEADSSQIQQILMNLAVNSRDAMPSGGVITVRTRWMHVTPEIAQTMVDAREGNFVCLSVEDTGTGIAPDVLQRVFEPFFTTKEAGKGTGLGLSTVFGIVTKHNGWIEVQSNLGHGTIFRIFLPRIDSARIASDLEIKAQVDFTGNGETVLVVEDNEAVRRFAVEALTANNYNVLQADSAREARVVFAAHQQEIDLVFSDIVLPDASGIFLVQEFAIRKPGLPVFLTTGFPLDERHLGQIQTMDFPLMHKPYTIIDLLRFIKVRSTHAIQPGDQCELIQECSFFGNFNDSSSALLQGWLRMFCLNKQKSERCKRKQHLQKTGAKPDPRMTPTGNILPE